MSSAFSVMLIVSLTILATCLWVAPPSSYLEQKLWRTFISLRRCALPYLPHWTKSCFSIDTRSFPSRLNIRGQFLSNLLVQLLLLQLLLLGIASPNLHRLCSQPFGCVRYRGYDFTSQHITSFVFSVANWFNYWMLLCIWASRLSYRVIRFLSSQLV